MKNKLDSMYLLVLLAVMSSVLVIADVDNAYSDPVPVLAKSQDSISTVIFIPQIEPNTIYLDLINIGNGTAYFTDVIKSNLYPKKEASFSMIDSKIDSDKIKIRIPENIPAGNSDTLSIQIKKDLYQEGTYLGRFLINGTNFEVMPVSISVTSIVSPWFMFGMNLVGIFVAILVGWEMQVREKKIEHNKRIRENFDSVVHVTRHIVEINNERKRIDQAVWDGIKLKADEYVAKLELEASQNKLSPKSETYQYFESLLKVVHGHLYDSTRDDYPNDDYIRLPNIPFLISRLNENVDDVYQKITTPHDYFLKSRLSKRDFAKRIHPVFANLESEPESEKIHDVENAMRKIDLAEFKKDLNDYFRKRDYSGSKKVFFSLSLIFSSITSLLVIDAFVGHVALNAIFAIGTGFSIYRIQDLQKLMKQQS